VVCVKIASEVGRCPSGKAKKIEKTESNALPCYRTILNCSKVFWPIAPSNISKQILRCPIHKEGSHARSAAGSGFRRVSINVHGSAPGAIARDGTNPKRNKPNISQEIFLMCDDIKATVEELTGKGAEFTQSLKKETWGFLTYIRIPGGGEIGLYQPTHPTISQTNKR